MKLEINSNNLCTWRFSTIVDVCILNAHWYKQLLQPFHAPFKAYYTVLLFYTTDTAQKIQHRAGA